MKNASIFNIVGQARPEKKAKAKEKKPRKKSGKKPKWGTPEEKYRRLCLHAQLCRFAYYVKNISIVPDEAYDRLERVILAIENSNREVMSHRYSPTCRSGSDKVGDYPLSVRIMWINPEDGELLQLHFRKVMEEAITSACEAFGVEVV